MLSYQHGYHAGNFADVLKHLVLINILQYLIKKDKPMFYLDTHSGRGLYYLDNPQALKTEEYKNGIDIIWNNKEQLPNLFKPYLDIISKLNPNHKLKKYPGSPWIARQILRKEDRQAFCELHPEEFIYLEHSLKAHNNNNLFKEDGLIMLGALVPPKEKRGLIFIDPAYELKNDYFALPKILQKSYDKFATGVYCIWYPILTQGFDLRLKKSLKKINPQKYLCVEFDYAWDTNNMCGSGLWIMNPPYTLKEDLHTILKTLAKLFNPGKSSYRIETGE